MPRNQSGLTLLELIAALVIAAILIALAAPSYADLVQKRRLTSAAEEIAALVNYTQSVSVAKNEAAAFSFKRVSNTDWCAGVRLGSTACDCAIVDLTDAAVCKVDDVLHVVQGASLASAELTGITDGHTATANAYIYDPVRGIMDNVADTGNFTFVSERGSFSLRVEIMATGRVDVCNPDATKQVAGYQACANNN